MHCLTYFRGREKLLKELEDAKKAPKRKKKEQPAGSKAEPPSNDKLDGIIEMCTVLKHGVWAWSARRNSVRILTAKIYTDS